MRREKSMNETRDERNAEQKIQTGQLTADWMPTEMHIQYRNDEWKLRRPAGCLADYYAGRQQKTHYLRRNLAIALFLFLIV